MLKTVKMFYKSAQINKNKLSFFGYYSTYLWRDRNIEVMKIAIVRLSALGDIAQSLLGAWQIKQNFKSTHITWFVEASFADLIKLCPFVDEVVALELKALKKNFSISHLKKELQKLQNKSFDYIVDMQGLLKSAVIARFLGKKTYGFSKIGLREKIARFFYSQKISSPYEKNVLLRYQDLINGVFDLNFSPKDLENSPPFLVSNFQNLGELFSETKKNVVFCVGASWQSKIYPAQKLAKIIQDLEANCILVWGSEKEKAAAWQIQKIAPKAKLAPKLSLENLVGFLSKASLVIGGDTGPVHIAWALNQPTIFIFGPTPSQRNAFADKNTIIIDSGKKINPLKLDKNDFCIKNINEEKIIRAANEILAR